MYRVHLEIACPKHGFEKFSIKVLKRYNIPAKEITPRFQKLKADEIKCLYIGRDVTKREIKTFFDDYFSLKGEDILQKMQIKEVSR
jgi:hypothetical protein